jgi:hypothetical protein
MSRPSLILPEVVDCTAREAELPAFVDAGRHAHGWLATLVRLVFTFPGQGLRITRPSVRRCGDVGRRTAASGAKHARTFAAAA